MIPNSIQIKITRTQESGYEAAIIGYPIYVNGDTPSTLFHNLIDKLADIYLDVVVVKEDAGYIATSDYYPAYAVSGLTQHEAKHNLYIEIITHLDNVRRNK